MRERRNGRSIHCAALAALSVLFFISAPRAADDAILVEIELNGEIKGNFVLLEEGSRGYWVREQDLIQLRLIMPENTPRWVVQGEGYRLIDCAKAFFKCNMDMALARLTIMADPGLFPRNEVAPNIQNRPPLTESSSGFLNYNVTYRRTPDGRQSIATPIEVGWRAGPWLAVGDASYLHTDGEGAFARMFTTLERVDPDDLTRIAIGDFTASSGSLLGGGGVFGGVSYSSDFALDPFFVHVPGLEVSGVLELPSQVEVFANGQSIAREDLPPGPFDLSNVARNGGATDTVIVIRDPFGNVRQINSSVYVPQRMLRKGVHEFSYAAGFKRRNLGRESFDYDDWAVLGFHRAGLTSTLTLGAHAELDKDTSNAGIEGNAVIGDFGEISLDLSASRHGGKSGAAAALAYYYSNRAFFSSLVTRGYTDDYAIVNLVPGRGALRYDGQATLGYHLSGVGGFVLNYREAGYFDDTVRRGTEFRYNASLFRGLIFSASYTHHWQSHRYNAFAGLSYYFGGGVSGSVNYRGKNDSMTNSVSLRKSADGYRGVGFWIRGDRHSGADPSFSYDGEISYYGPVGHYRASVTGKGAQRSYAASASGGIAFIGGGAYLTPPLRTGFALVDTGVPDVGIKLNNQRVGRTGISGKTLITGLSPYSENKIAVEVAQLPADQMASTPELRLATYSRGGIAVNLPVRITRPVYGKLLVTEGLHGERAEFWGLRIKKNGRVIREYLIGKRGEFYLDDLSPGSFAAEAFIADRTCGFTLVIPDTKEIGIDLGEVICEMQ